MRLLPFCACLMLLAVACRNELRITSSSMEPTLKMGDIVQVERVGTRVPALGDLVLVRPARKPESTLIKRVVAVPGDRVEIRSAVVDLNGVALKEPYLAVPNDADFRNTFVASQMTNMAEILVPNGKYFVLGDNRNKSFDSRHYGPVALEDILGYVQSPQRPAF